jgi:ABC-type hemin transport system ATPase subunit
MPQTLAENILRNLDHTAALYHRLILVVAPTGAGKTAALKAVQTRTNAPLINVNLEISRRLLDLTLRQRALKLPRLMTDMLNSVETELVLLDNIEILFDVSLQQDPLRLLQGISRNKTVVATWNGKPDEQRLMYAAPGHPEWRSYGQTELSGILRIHHDTIREG